MMPRDTLDLIRDRLDDLNYKFNLLIEELRVQDERNREYWRIVDGLQAQLRLMRWLLGGGWMTTLLIWLYTGGGP
jgi:hypothetical protein